jgi:murein DD-endopeptidase MepM/ murein hydrolase activator NlpD
LRGVHRVPRYVAKGLAERPRPGRRYPRRAPARALPVFLLALAALCAAGAALWRVSDGDPAWWLTHDAPPEFSVAPPDGPRRGTVSVGVRVDPVGRAGLVSVTVDGTPLALPPAAVAAPPGAPGGAATIELAIDTAALADGHHVLHLEAVDRSLRRNRSVKEVALTSDNTAPALALDAGGAVLRAGRPLLVRWGANEPADLDVTWSGEAVPGLPDAAAPGGGRFFSFLAVPVEAGPGEAALRLAGRDAAGNAAEQALTLAVEPNALPRQTLIVPPALAALATGPVAGDESARVAALTSPVTPGRQWSGPFRLPLPGEPQRTTGFGDRRDYADGYVVYHAGYDLAASAGAAVAACAGGTVIFAGALPQRGNAVIVDHGWGVYTLYGHLQPTDVPVGQRVAAGDTIGRVGSTGLSTGPHLHWEVRLRGLAVDPGAWLELSTSLER